MLDKRCIDCKNLEWHGKAIQCGKGYWRLESDTEQHLRKKNKRAEACLEYRYVLTD